MQPASSSTAAAEAALQGEGAGRDKEDDAARARCLELEQEVATLRLSVARAVEAEARAAASASALGTEQQARQAAERELQEVATLRAEAEASAAAFASALGTEQQARQAAERELSTMREQPLVSSPMSAKDVFPSSAPPELISLSAETVALRIDAIAIGFKDYHQSIIDKGYDGLMVSTFAGRRFADVSHDLQILGVHSQPLRDRIVVEFNKLFDPLTYPIQTAAAVQPSTASVRTVALRICASIHKISIITLAQSHFSAFFSQVVAQEHQVLPFLPGDGQVTPRNRRNCSML